ncbi:MAG: serine/threonine-protein kinase [Myxococcota bacterium]
MSSLIGKIVHQTYRLEEMLDEGGMGQVYVASHLRIPNRLYAVKRLLPELASSDNFRARFRIEAQAMIKLRHKHIVHLEDFLEESDTTYLIMEFIEGKPLDRILREQGKLTQKQAICLSLQVLDALQCCHEQGIIHRDLKPSNLLLDRTGDVKLTDFGISFLQGPQQRLTRTGSLLGTPDYMSPEQIQAKSVDHRSDLYSFGVMLHEMLQGLRPFLNDQSTDGIYAVLYAHVQSAPPALHKEIAPALRACVEKALAKSADQRFATATEMSLALAQVFEEKLCSRQLLVPLVGEISSRSYAQRPPATGATPNSAPDAWSESGTSAFQRSLDAQWSTHAPHKHSEHPHHAAINEKQAMSPPSDSPVQHKDAHSSSLPSADHYTALPSAPQQQDAQSMVQNQLPSRAIEKNRPSSSHESIIAISRVRMEACTNIAPTRHRNMRWLWIACIALLLVVGVRYLPTEWAPVLTEMWQTLTSSKLHIPPENNLSPTQKPSLRITTASRPRTKIRAIAPQPRTRKTRPQPRPNTRVAAPQPKRRAQQKHILRPRAVPDRTLTRRPLPRVPPRYPPSHQYNLDQQLPQKTKRNKAELPNAEQLNTMIRWPRTVPETCAVFLKSCLHGCVDLRMKQKTDVLKVHLLHCKKQCWLQRTKPPYSVLCEKMEGE